uniref:Probable protein kinase DDB_G0277539 n=1 Tax=Dermatophagoides pteronyssinus TaxID=6956 RepID=A0A6P6Y4Y5_DERPT|nr:probable protein kinase DDB_G0277539 [Dermatophagoides pteronyssinus]
MEWQQSCNNNNGGKRKHSKRLWLEMMTIYSGLKASYIWDISSEENLLKIYHHLLDEINIDYRRRRPTSVGWPNIINGQHSTMLSIVKLSLTNSSAATTTTTTATDNNQTMPVIFYGNIHQMIENINSTLVKLDVWIQNDNQNNQNNNNEHSFIHHLSSSPYTNLIDVSAELNEPKIITTIVGQQQQQQQNQNNNKEEETMMMMSLKYCLLHIRNQLVDDDVDVNEPRCFDIHFDNNNNCDLCAISGILLGYPIIYCNRYSNDDGNCLANQLLRNYQICMENSETKESFIVYSFTIPEKFVLIYQSKIDQWFDYMKQRFRNNIVLKMQYKLECHPFILT